jgi:hypothetical protein
LRYSDIDGLQECNVRMRICEDVTNNLIALINKGNSTSKQLEDEQTHQKEIDNERARTEF